MIERNEYGYQFSIRKDDDSGEAPNNRKYLAESSNSVPL